MTHRITTKDESLFLPLLPGRRMSVNLRIFHTALNAYRSEKASDRHSRMLLAGIRKIGYRVPPFANGVRGIFQVTKISVEKELAELCKWNVD